MPKLTNKQKYQEYVKNARERDWDWHLDFYKQNVEVDSVKLRSNPDNDSGAIPEAIKSFEEKYRVNNWKDIADEHRTRHQDMG
jgi:hypothetical protein